MKEIQTDDIDFNNYDYILFIDASGDDGFNFENNSSKCYTTGCFITSPADIEYNENILLDMKRISDRQPNDELKYSSLKRHKYCNEALMRLSSLKGEIFSYNVFKYDIFLNGLEEYLSNTKTLRN